MKNRTTPSKGRRTIRISTAACFALSFHALAAHANTACDGNGPLTILSATDDGSYSDNYSPDKSIDGKLEAESRWSSQSQGVPKALLLNLGAQQTLKSLSVAWHSGDSRKSRFSVETSVDGKTYQALIAERQTSGSSKDLEAYSFAATKAQYIRINANGNEKNDWNSIVEVTAFGCGTAVAKPDRPVLTEQKGKGMFGLHMDRPPAANFDLKGWKLDTPGDADGDGIGDIVEENQLAAGFTDPRYFYTDPATGGMVFRVTPAGAKTSKNTSYTRSELRAMLRHGDESIATRAEGGYPNRNNWVFSSAPLAAQAKAGGVDGTLSATLSVNQVTRLGKDSQVGRVIIGQIHAKNDEPIRLYYRKLPQNKYGSIYFAHDPEKGKEAWVEVIGSRSDKAGNPQDGIALDEVFSYEIKVKGVKEGDKTIPMLYLKIIRDNGKEIVAEPFDMRDSGFSVEDDFMFFKAGAYTGNNTSPEPEKDFDKVIFYKLDYAHDPAPAISEAEKAKAATAEPIQLAAAGTAATAAAASAMPAAKHLAAREGVVFDDHFADGDRSDGADASDSNWWTTTNSTAIEVNKGSLGLVSGSSGRGIRTTFAPQNLAQGQTLKATFNFTTPATVGSDIDSALRVGIYDKLGREQLESDQSASSNAPNAAYDGLPGYMIDFDVNPADAAAANIDVRKHKQDTQGRLLGTTKGYERLAGGGLPYQFAPNTAYSGTIAVQRLANGVKITGTLSQEGKLLSEFSTIDEGSTVNNFGMLAFHVNSKAFGSANSPDQPDNGIDFSSVRLEVLPK
ncbi:MAG: polysaccharide lyase family 7 protein [Rhodocyclaceae bacterium]|nr:polysaccharide lyase family 7 protein [Rhodocyclaceae bacterium]